ncbi:hypothetical protein HHI36_016761 [Cryptolaemus montrouzieri]|uniref:Uncharacterized protein n=1 Tax=Cryptolaemus montrouzieri TaxID=559131 RepID=A0ABD2NKM8_9CUCU
MNSKLFESLERLEQWFNENELQLNTGRNQIINFNYGTEFKSITCTNDEQASLKTSESVCFFGIHLDHRLSWKSHVDVLYKHMASYTYAKKTQAYSAKPKYGIIFWGGFFRDRQKQCLRSIFRLPYDVSYESIFVENLILTAVCLHIYDSVLFVAGNSGLFLQSEPGMNMAQEENIKTTLYI